jgi:hypothetical protein
MSISLEHRCLNPVLSHGRQAPSPLGICLVTARINRLRARTDRARAGIRRQIGGLERVGAVSYGKAMLSHRGSN